MDILIADDLDENRLVLTGWLKQLGYSTIPARDGEEAFAILRDSQINFLITDWMMPRLSGVELCRKIRSENLGRYIYIILLTARQGRDELIEGLNAGADDYLTKPFNPQEMRVRILTGLRILELEKNLNEQRKIIEESHRKLQHAYSVITKNIDQAAALQRELLPGNKNPVQGWRFDWLFIPSQGVAGDIFNVFALDDNHLAFYQLDVAGHGIASSMMSFALSKFLSPVPGKTDMVFCKPDQGKDIYRHPSLILANLNSMFCKEYDSMQFFTICYGIIDTGADSCVLTRAGHPMPILQLADGTDQFVGPKGLPVAMVKETEYQDTNFEVHSGDRLYIYSDGIIEAPNSQGELFGVERLQAVIHRCYTLPLDYTVAAIRSELIRWKGDDIFDDDISLLILEKEQL